MLILLLINYNHFVQHNFNITPYIFHLLCKKTVPGILNHLSPLLLHVFTPNLFLLSWNHLSGLWVWRLLSSFLDEWQSAYRKRHMAVQQWLISCLLYCLPWQGMCKCVKTKMLPTYYFETSPLRYPSWQSLFVMARPAGNHPPPLKQVQSALSRVAWPSELSVSPPSRASINSSSTRATAVGIEVIIACLLNSYSHVSDGTWAFISPHHTTTCV